MNYPESEAIKQKIDSVQKILLNCHHNPDADSVGSALAMARVLKKWGKEVRILSSTPVSKNLQFLVKEENIKVTDFTKFNYTAFDLFITLDSSSWSRTSGTRNFEKPKIPFVVIDHHKSNQKFGDINLLVPDASANSLVLYKLYQDWNTDLSSDVAEPLLAGILGDTGGLRFPEADIETFEIALQLMKVADKNKIMFNLYQSFEISHVNVWKEVMNNLYVDIRHKFVYSFIRKEVMEKNGYPDNAKAEVSDMLFQGIDGTDFGVVGVEDKEGYVSVSFRSRTGVDVSRLASELGGGGHQWASAGRVYEDFDKAVELILQKCREFSSKNV